MKQLILRLLESAEEKPLSDYNAILQAHYKRHAKMVSAGVLDPTPGSGRMPHISDPKYEDPINFGYWQKRLTRTDRAKHLASVVFAIHKTHDEDDWDHLSKSDKNKAQEFLAGGERDHRDAYLLGQSFAKKLASQRLSYDSSALSAHANPNVNDTIIHHFALRNEAFTEDEIDYYEFIAESSNYDAWLNDMAKAAREGQARLRDEKNQTGVTKSGFDTSYKHPDTPGFGYQGGAGKKKAEAGRVSPDVMKVRLWAVIRHNTTAPGSRGTLEDFWTDPHHEMGMQGAQKKFREHLVDYHMAMRNSGTTGTNSIHHLVGIAGTKEGVDKITNAVPFNQRTIGPLIRKVRQNGVAVDDHNGNFAVDVNHFDFRDGHLVKGLMDNPADFRIGIGSHEDIHKYKWTDDHE